MSKLSTIVWLTTGFAFLNFVYELIERKKDFLYRVNRIIVMLVSLITLGTNYITDGYSRYDWGVSERSGPFYELAMVFVIIVPVIFGIVQMWRYAKNVTDNGRKRQLSLIVFGTITAASVATLSGLVLPWTGYKFVIFTAEATVFQTIAVCIGILRYDFLSMGIEEIANDLFTHVQEGIIILNRDEQIVQINSTARYLFNVCGDRDLKLSVKDLMPEYQSGFSKTNYEIKINKGDSIKVVLVSENPIHYLGETSGKLILLYDITDMKRTEEELRISQEQLRRIFDYANDGIDIVEYNPDTKVRRLVMCNDSFVKMSGFTREDLMKSDNLNSLVTFFNFVELDSSEDNEAAATTQKITSIDGTQEYYKGISKWNRPDGKECIYEWTAVPWIDQDKMYLVGIDRDITERIHAENALRESEERYRRLVQTMPDAVIIHASGKVKFINPSGARLFGFRTCEEIIGLEIINFIHPDYRQLVEERIRLTRDKGEDLPLLEEKFIRVDGSVVDVEVSAINFSINGEAASLVIARDITSRKMAETALRESEERYRTLFDLSPDAIILFEARENDVFWPIVECNRAACEMNGYSREELIGQSIDIFHQHPVSLEKRQEEYRRIQIEGKNPPAEIIHVRKDGTLVSIENHIHLIQFAGKELLLGIDRDITERKRAEEIIHYQTYFDALTGFPNRLMFNDRLSIALNQAEKAGDVLALLFLDIDRFKLINDTLGHDMGDMLLKEVATRLVDRLGDSDVLARFGGDEFVILLPQVERLEEVAKLAQDLLDNFKKPVMLRQMEVFSTLSIGIAVFPNDGEDVETLLKNADAALHRAKEQGRNIFHFYTPSINERATKKLTLENQLRRALVRNEFTVYYQPQVDARTGRFVGMEALLRWKHPKLGLVSPAEFIPLAEETGLIVPIGEWVLKKACEENKRWHEAGYKKLRVAVNLSARQFSQQNLVEMVSCILKDTGLPPEYLELEITESVAMQNADYTVVVLRKLGEMGVRISLDDFGTGYSSFGYLKQFPLNALKIDRSFVNDLVSDVDDAIAKTIIVLGHSMSLSVVAEGVETMEQFNILKQLNCDYVQGYYFGHPISSTEFEKFLSTLNNE